MTIQSSVRKLHSVASDLQGEEMNVFEAPSDRLISVIVIGLPDAANELIGDELLVAADKPRSSLRLVSFELEVQA